MNLDKLKKLPRKSPLLPGLLVLLLAPILAAYAADRHTESRHEVEGVIQTMPDGRVGTWKINDRQVKTDAKTRFDETECPIKVGSNVEAKGQLQDQTLLAEKVECEGPEESEKSEEQEQDD